MVRRGSPAIDGSGQSYLLLTYDSCRYDVMAAAHTPVLDSYAPAQPAQSPANFTFAAHQAFFVGMLPNVTTDVPYYNRFRAQLLNLGGLAADRPGRPVHTRVVSTWNVVDALRSLGHQTVGAGAMDWFRSDALTSAFEKFRFTGTDADRQIDFLTEELDLSRPFFGFINFGETHAPYTFRGKPKPDLYPMDASQMRWPPVERGPVGAEAPHFTHQREAVEFLDERIARLFAGLPPSTIVVLCGDHGECFGEDGYWGHGVSHPKVFEVPLSIFRLDRRPLEIPAPSKEPMRDRFYHARMRRRMR